MIGQGAVQDIPAGSDVPFTVLVVCTANRYRSPIAEHLLRAAAARRGLDWTIRSAGTNAVPGRRMDDAVLHLLREHDVPVADWHSRRVDPELLARADLILTAQQQHRRIVVGLEPPAVTRTFSLKQFARLSAAIEPDGTSEPVRTGAELLRRATRARAGLQPVPTEAEDLADPVGRPARILRRCLGEVESAVDQIMSAVRP